MIPSTCRHRTALQLRTLLAPPCPGAYSRREPFNGHWRQRFGSTVALATNSCARRYGTFRPSNALYSKSKSGQLTLEECAAELVKPGTRKRAAAAATAGRPKKSVVSLDDLLCVNPNPTIFDAMPPAILMKQEDLATEAPAIVVEPKRKQKSKAKETNTQEGSTPTNESVKRKTKKKISDPMHRISPLRKQILELESAYPDCVLLVRVGEFYELYDHNATEYGHLLGLKIGSKVFTGQTIPFTGFPVRQLDRHLETLVARHHLKVALCEQYQDETEPGSSISPNQRSFRRSVHRIITPGTLIDEQFLDQGENNWLLAVASDRTSHSLGLSWLDLSTGDFFTQETTYDNFANDLARIRPREVLVNSNLRTEAEHPVMQTLQNLGPFVISFEDMQSAAQLAIQVQHPILNEAQVHLGFDPSCLEEFTNREQSACLAILRYVNHTQMGRRPVVQQPIEWEDDSILKIDRNTIEALELVRTLRDSSRIGSLLYYLDQTRTKAGSRLLSDWLTSPLTNTEKINGRLDMVEFLSQDSHLMSDIDLYLSECRDAQRAIQKLSMGQIHPQDLVTIRVTMEALQKIKERMADKIMLLQHQSPGFQAQFQVKQDLIGDGKDISQVGGGGGGGEVVPTLAKDTLDNIQGLEHICELIRNVVDESMDQHQEYGFINEGVSPMLNDLHEKLRKLKVQKKNLLHGWTSHLGGVKPFEIKSSFGYRHIIEMRSTVTAERLRELLEGQVVDVSHADQRRSKVRYQVPILSELMESIERLESQIVQEEKSILRATRSEILEESTAIVQNCRYIAQLDVLMSFAKMMLNQRYVRPVLNGGDRLIVESGRHPVVEIALQGEGRHFVENNCSVGHDEQIWLLTGPNMGGKSTFLRQNVILTIMAQMGSFVPAARMELGIVDKVFSRLGASDNLANSQSTFMVEMTETASILQHATERSLVIMDEVGRGTATIDGCAIAYATLHHLYHVNRSRTLFATHYHELADMVGAAPAEGAGVGGGVVVKTRAWRDQEVLEKVKCYQTTIEEWKDGSFTYVHQVVPGVCRQSHGIHVARLAGMPPSAVEVSSKILWLLQAG